MKNFTKPFIVNVILLAILPYLSALQTLQAHEKYRAIVFDLGSVLVWDQKSIVHHIVMHEREKFPEVTDALQFFNLAEMLNGLMSFHQLTERLAPHCDISKLQAIIEQHPKFLTPLEEGMQIFGAVKQAGYKVYLLSNTIHEHVEKMVHEGAFMQEVDGAIFSYLVGSRKPEPEIYKKLLETYGLQPEECLFIDDLKENVDMAQKMGIDSILCTDHAAVMQQLKDLKIVSRTLNQVIQREIIPGLTYAQVIIHEPVPFSIHVLEIDPSAVAIKIALSKEQKNGLAITSSIAKEQHALVAINGGFYKADATPAGILKVDGVLVGEQKKFPRGALGWTYDGKQVLIDYITEDQDQADFWKNMDYVVGGTPILVKGSQIITDFSLEKILQSFIDGRFARTAVGILPNKHWLFVVVDQKGERVADGMTLHELADLMKKLGCSDAINLSGGKTSTMCVDEKLVSYSFGDLYNFADFLEKEVFDVLVVVNREDEKCGKEAR